MKIEHYYICKPVEGICKQYAIWVGEGNQSTPLIYLQRPKHVPIEKWAEICQFITLQLPKNYEI